MVISQLLLVRIEEVISSLEKEMIWRRLSKILLPYMAWRRRLLPLYRHLCNNWLTRTRRERRIIKYLLNSSRAKTSIWILSHSLCHSNKHLPSLRKILPRTHKMCTTSDRCLPTISSRLHLPNMTLSLQEKTVLGIMVQRVQWVIKNKLSLNIKASSPISNNKVEFNWFKKYHYSL